MAPSSPPLILPCYAVIFTSRKRNDKDYQATAIEMDMLAAKQPGYLGVDSIANAQPEIKISCWQTLDSIRVWKQNLEHIKAQQQAQDKWYQDHVCKVKRSYSFSAKL